MREWRHTAMLGEGAAAGTALAAAGTMPRLAPAGNVGGAMVGVPASRALVPVEDVAVEREPPAGVHMPGPSPWPFFAPIALMVVFYGLIFSPILIVGGVILAAIAAGGWLRDASREYRSTEVVGHAVPETRDPRRAWPRRVLPIFGGVIAVCLVLLVLPSVGNFFSGLKPGGASPSAVAVPAKPEISASSAVSFDTKTLIVPAGRAFELTFHNKNAGVPHNVEIANGPDRATLYLDGEVITGVTDATYQVKALEPGNYYFLCKVHPNMNGTVQAIPETGPGGAPEGPPVPGPGSPAAGSTLP
jgi:plastocyanin